MMRAHAKINLTLLVGGRQPDGYHELRTIFQSLALHDTLEVRERPGALAIECDDPAVQTDSRNLVWRAAARVWEASGRPGPPEGALVTLRKRIPAQGGLGGGSSNAAVALVAFERLWHPAMPAEVRLGLARRLGADVPFFLCGGTAAGVGRGDEVTPLPDLPPCHVVLVFPPFGVPTADAYRWLDEDRARGGEGPAGLSGSAGALTYPFQEASPGQVVHLADGTPIAILNDLEAPVVARHPEIGRIRDALRAAGADGAAMCGSGSTVFGLFRDAAAAAAAGAVLAAEGWRTTVSATAGRDEAAGFLV